MFIYLRIRVYFINLVYSNKLFFHKQQINRYLQSWWKLNSNDQFHENFFTQPIGKLKLLKRCIEISYNNNNNNKSSRTNKAGSRDTNKRGWSKSRDDGWRQPVHYDVTITRKKMFVYREEKNGKRKGDQIGTGGGRIKLTMRAAEASKMDPEKIQGTIRRAHQSTDRQSFRFAFHAAPAL